jgi:hypothetical protein
MDASRTVLSEWCVDTAPVRIRGRRRHRSNLLVCDAGEGVEEVDCVAALFIVSTTLA